jgi:hypothetical protein
MPKADYSYDHVRSRREIVDLLRHWEPKLRACGSDWESGMSGYVRYHILCVANSMLRVLERGYPVSGASLRHPAPYTISRYSRVTHVADLRESSTAVASRSGRVSKPSVNQAQIGESKASASAGLP